MTKKIVVTGGSGRFGSCLKNTVKNHKIFFPEKKIFNILNPDSMRKFKKNQCKNSHSFSWFIKTYVSS